MNHKNKIPERYVIKETESGRILTCLEAPNLVVRLERGKSVPGPIARKSPERTIFLDGAARSEPFMDHEQQIYNLDHHEGCIRSFTYSTCEQAIVMVRRGLSLSEKNWTIWANDPDLDTVLAIWVLFNHLHLKKGEPYVRREILPLLRLEGIIDGLGLEFQDLVAFPERLQRETSNRIAFLREEEGRLKSEGRWDSIDFAEYTIGVLQKIDELVYHPEDFKDFKGLEELARREISDDASVVVYRADMGIYEMEEQLMRLYEKRPALILLQKSPGVYTIRKTDLFWPYDLSRLYERLNRMDRAVHGRDPDNRWGGSGEIGGSPRRTGTFLQPDEIAEICREAAESPSPLEKAIRFSWSAFLALAVPVMSWAIVALHRFFHLGSRILHGENHIHTGLYSPLLMVYTTAFYFLQARAKPWVYGFRLPSGRDWWLLIPGVAAGVLLGGIWTPDLVHQGRYSVSLLSADLIFVPMALELLFRGLLHGQFSDIYPVQRTGGRWFVSRPALFSGLLYALFMLLSPVLFFQPSVTGIPEALWIPRLIGSFLFGTFAAMARERSDSILIPALIHSVASGILFFFRSIAL